MKTNRIRILNKTSKTVTLKMVDGPMVFTWEEFNKKLVVVDKVWAIPNPEEEKKYAKAEDLLGDAIVCVMLQRGSAEPVRKLAALARLGEISKEVCSLLECTPFEFTQLVQQRLKMLNPWMVNPMFDEDEEESEEEYEEECEKYEEYVDDRNTLGANFSCLEELKRKMEAES